jgi:hypothetical protein
MHLSTHDPGCPQSPPFALWNPDTHTSGYDPVTGKVFFYFGGLGDPIEIPGAFKISIENDPDDINPYDMIGEWYLTWSGLDLMGGPTWEFNQCGQRWCLHAVNVPLPTHVTIGDGYPVDDPTSPGNGLMEMIGDWSIMLENTSCCTHAGGAGQGRCDYYPPNFFSWGNAWDTQAEAVDALVSDPPILGMWPVWVCKTAHWHGMPVNVCHCTEYSDMRCEVYGYPCGCTTLSTTLKARDYPCYEASSGYSRATVTLQPVYDFNIWRACCGYHKHCA